MFKKEKTSTESEDDSTSSWVMGGLALSGLAGLAYINRDQLQKKTQGGLLNVSTSTSTVPTPAVVVSPPPPAVAAPASVSFF